jgi:glyoxylase-like metal-dependent hydrolase (beta-lactamase superfamily II)
MKLGNERIELLNLGPAHSPGDIVVWLPAKRLVISGDMAFHERLLPVFEHTDTAAWIESWDRFESLGAELVIPGHGSPTDMQEVTKYTRDYLKYMRERVLELLDEGGTLADAYKIDQSPYSHLDTFDELARQNAGRIFRQMEFE